MFATGRFSKQRLPIDVSCRWAPRFLTRSALFYADRTFGLLFVVPEQPRQSRAYLAKLMTNSFFSSKMFSNNEGRVAAPSTKSPASLTLIQKLNVVFRQTLSCPRPYREEVIWRLLSPDRGITCDLAHATAASQCYSTSHRPCCRNGLLREPFFRRTVGCMPCHFVERSSWKQDGILPLPQFRCPL